MGKLNNFQQNVERPCEGIPPNSVYCNEHMFNIEIPSGGDQKSGGSSSTFGMFNFQLRKIQVGARNIMPRSPNLQINCSIFIQVIHKIFDNVFNALTLIFIFLAVCTSVYSQLSEYYLLQDTKLTDIRADAIPYVVAALQDQSIGGLNATSWNLIESAKVSLLSLSESYANAQVDICSAFNATSGTVYGEHQSDIQLKRAVSWENSNASKWASSHCSFPHKKGNYSSYGQDKITEFAQSIAKNISNLTNIRVPLVNTSSLNSQSYIQALDSIKKTRNAWISVFSVMATLSIGLNIFWRLVLYHYKTELEVKQSDVKDQSLTFVERYSRQTIAKTSSIYWYVCDVTLTGHINRLLAISMILIMFSVSNSTILNKISADQSATDPSIGQQWLNSTANTFTQYESMFNNKTLQIIGSLIHELNGNHFIAQQEFSTFYDFALNSSIPFPYGVAINIISLPLVGNRQLPSTMITSGSAIENSSNMLLHILKNIITGSWISAVVLLCIWVVSNIAAYFSQ